MNGSGGSATVPRIDPATTAVLVVDMQNDFVSPGGMFALAGIDVGAVREAVAPTASVLVAARRVGIPVVYLTMAYREDLSDLGAPGSPNRTLHDRLRVGDVVPAPDGARSRILVRDTWSSAVVDELAPQPGDRVVVKHRFSGFFETDLDRHLREAGVRDLIVAGCTTSVCLDSTVRDAAFRDYSCLVLADCTAEPLGVEHHRSTLGVLGAMFAVLTDSAAVIRALDALRPADTGTHRRTPAHA